MVITPLRGWAILSHFRHCKTGMPWGRPRQIRSGEAPNGGALTSSSVMSAPGAVGMGMPTIVALAGQRRAARSCRGKLAVSHLDYRAAPWPSSRLGGRPEQASRCWSRSRDIVGRSQIASRPRRMSWASTTTRPAPARLVPPRLTRHARLRHYGRHSASRKHRDAPKADAQDDEHLSPPLIRWSVQKIRRIAVRLARRRIHPANITAWSLWRRAHPKHGVG